MAYCSLADAKAELKATGTVDNDKLLRFVRQVSARINTIMNPRLRRPLFEPYYEQRPYVLAPRQIDSSLNAFYFKDALLSLSSILVNTSDVTSLVEAWPLGETPFRAVRFVGGVSSWYHYCHSGYDPVYIYVTGLWGIRADYANAWVEYDTIQTNPMAPGDTTFQASDAGGDDPYGIAPRFSPGQLLRIAGGDEILRVSAVDETTDIVTTQRKQNGTSLPSGDYAIGSSIEVFEPEEPIRRITARQAALMYARMGAFQIETLDGVGVVTYPQDLLIELQNTLTDYQYV